MSKDPRPHGGKPVTLCLLVKADEVLLAMKKKGFGEGKWNGVGGKVETGETSKEAAVRETQEEIRVTPTEIEHRATIYYEPYKISMSVYIVTEWTGQPTETDEMAPKWFKKDDLPQEMWESDKYWMPRVLNGERLTARFVYDQNNKLLKKSIKQGQ
ncbi:MAG: hypothetical protein A3H88_01410 [Candidatus Blackburnbacteria bacterium RIFCSPLOWO2_02_FULL_44_9]|uniref:Oxidized purine nucleoside triphosphate hydrolase n=1 Tax=Candidatus Blackburnbacteria bacterium RIFCSPHIGHO2_02_FULL_44_20 TaxID=1797516 RepID=A0A1G1V487_9BACT|nr:MAG: hypothetical protein A3D26_04495 [Candidatus Blackburnbacteria bacterium RIFCSPHIGHO2_02_FULL_44_20]OGY10349.1 MAG: hypothetical protein A3E16_02775 [Candidatus Blackburnbacteria bacterium RIFCSPHIGHO2_12_FULL_44_25]OGY15198.1 MAG: hypothetical protein A3A62_02505 [Candidatus Blackburnbacteria bacterium RIFCSPLOWO2_01_FULL_44_43]OGY15834.1 MAG: hypothetical protein A3H88_01410 [Candidatus Blackburnbacteria bacterium RIFCSPLOWO2_02_FULL_44_9]